MNMMHRYLFFVFCVGFVISAVELQARQDSFFYTNNYGASAKNTFPFPVQGSKAKENSLGLARHDVDVILGGRIRQEGFLFVQPLTLRDDYNDVYGFARSKLNLDFHTQYGRRAYKKPAAEMHMRLTAFSLWDDPTVYTPIVEQDVEFMPSNFLKKALIGKHHHRGVVPFIYLDDGWVNVNFDTFIKDLPWAMSLKIGNFPFLVGRGVALGDYFEGGVEYLGWRRHGDIGNSTQRPPGVLFHIDMNDNIACELYYSKWRKRSHGPDWTREEVRAKRLDVPDQTQTKDIQRGVGGDRNLFAARIGYNEAIDDGNVYIEPYMVFVDAPELEVEFEADSRAKLTTLGVMAEWNAGGWSFNAEVAGQFGYQQIHAIDRNHLVVDDAYYLQHITSFSGADAQFGTQAGRLDETMGVPVKYHSHIFLGVDNSGSEYLPYRAYYVSDEFQHINRDRRIEAQGKTIKTESGAEYVSVKHTSSVVGSGNDNFYSSYQFKTGVDYYDTVFGLLGKEPDGKLHNANLPFAGMRRFRPEYTLDCASFMGLLDATYTFDEYAKMSCACGYVGGDDYPFNTEVNKDYHGFIPLRDGNYVGRGVTSFVVLYPRKVPRPTAFSDDAMFAYNNYQTMQNLIFVGVGGQWFPHQGKETFMLEMNALYFWEVKPPYTWDKTKKRVFAANTATDSNGDGKEDTLYKYLQDKELFFSGSATTQRASSRLGAELNAVVKWKPFDNCEFVSRIGFFFPGKLYRDIGGMPNINTIRVDKDGENRFDDLGSKVITGGMLRLTYKF